MSPPAQENWVLAEFGKIDKRLIEIDRKLETLTTLIGGQGTRLAVLETKEQGVLGGIKWVGSLIAGSIGAVIALVGSWLSKP